MNSFHGQLQLAFMPRFAYRCETISRALSLISVSDTPRRRARSVRSYRRSLISSYELRTFPAGLVISAIVLQSEENVTGGTYGYSEY